MVYIGKNGKAASVSAIKVGDANGKAKNVVGGWVGDENGKARRIWSGSGLDAFRFKVNGAGSITFSGNVEISDGSRKKQYTSATDETYSWNITAKTITIRGELTNIRFGSTSSLEEILSVFPASMSGVTDFSSMFRDSYNLTAIPAGLFDNCPNVTSFNNTFNGCTNLTSIPAGLFDNCPDVASFYNTFNDCTNLASIPAGLFDNCPDVTSFRNAFSNCTSLAAIPAGLFDNCPAVMNFSSTFYGCTAITSAVPELWDTATWPNARSHRSCFFNCTNAANYADIPAGWK